MRKIQNIQADAAHGAVPAARCNACGKLCRDVGETRARLIAAAAALAVVAAGCGATEHIAPPTRAQVAAGIAGSPAPLAAVHAQADRLLGGGLTAFMARITALRGYPVVVNKWGSWCPSCQSEFPEFQQVSLRFARRVAFLGLDGKDANAAASSFLRQHPVTYPSYTDPSEQIARAIRAATYYPQTIFFNRQGHVVYDHIGEYPSAAALISDIRRYALG